jgi:OOP family OmpA-OmpF porin
MIAAVAATLSALPAAAQWYAGAGIGRGNLGVSGTDLTGLTNATVEDGATVWGLNMGYRFHPNFALEAGYYDLGKYDFAGRAGAVSVTGDAKVESYSISLVAIAPLAEHFDIYGRVGYAHSKFKFAASDRSTAPSPRTRRTKRPMRWAATGGSTSKVASYAEWMKNDKTEIDNYMAGVTFRF